MQLEFYRHTFSRYEILAPNILLDSSTEMDLYGIRSSGYSDEIEIKISKSDYLADFKKVRPADILRRYTSVDELKHDQIKEGKYHCNYFSFFMPEELAEICTIPDYAGLYTYSVNSNKLHIVNEVIKAKKLNSNKVSDKETRSVGRKMAYRYWSSQK